MTGEQGGTSMSASVDSFAGGAAPIPSHAQRATAEGVAADDALPPSSSGLAACRELDLHLLETTLEHRNRADRIGRAFDGGRFEPLHRCSAGPHGAAVARGQRF